MNDRTFYQETFSRSPCLPGSKEEHYESAQPIPCPPPADAAAGGRRTDRRPHRHRPGRLWRRPVGLVFPGMAARTGQPMGESQTAVIHSLTQRVDQSVTAEGVTVTADSITVGSDSLWVLLRVTGAEFSPTQAYTFSEFDLQITPEAAPGKTTGVSAYGEHFWALTRAAHCSFCSNTRPVYPAKPSWATGRIS